jgi:hypothetical protein
MNLRRSLRISLVLLTVFFFASVTDTSAQLRAELIASGFTRPLGIVPDPTSPDVLFILEQGGTIWPLVNGVRAAEPFLDLTQEVKVQNEQGLLGLAFAPDGERVFVFWTKKRDPDLGIGDTIISRFRRSAGDPLKVDASVPRFDLVLPNPGSNLFPYLWQPTDVHKGGTLHFGPDGYLYIGLGDGGGFANEIVNAQNPGVLYGKMLRIDVNVPDSHPRGYVVPPDNPFLDGVPVAALPEIWSVGFRNPWRWSFDDFGPGATNAMIIGDVGQDAREEINYEPAGRGGRNYGWYIREGTLPSPFGFNHPPSFLPLTEPIADYPRSIGRSVTGGYVYRGSALPEKYRGRYFVADYFGGIYSVGLQIDGDGEARAVDVLDHTQELGDPFLVPTFGRDLEGELYFSTFIGGRIFKIVPETAPPAAPENFTSTVTSTTVSLAWQRAGTGGSPVGYRLEAGSSPGASDLLVTNVNAPELTVSGVPSGIYFVRVRAFNDLGISEPSEELEVQVGCVGALPTPTGLTGGVTGGVATVSWTPVAGATSYLVEVALQPVGPTALVIPTVAPVVSGPVPPGTYHARVRAVTPCGTTAPSEEITVTVP